MADNMTATTVPPPVAPAAPAVDAGGMLNLLCALSNVTYCEEGSNIFEPENTFSNETGCAEIQDDLCLIDRQGELTLQKIFYTCRILYTYSYHARSN